MSPNAEFWSQLPQAPGIYQMVGARERVIYVGRSGNLRDRVRSYWTADDPSRPWLRRMLPLVRRVDHIECISEHDAAFLERDLIARFEPRFNRTYGVESEWWLELGADHLLALRERSQGRCFGPYLGGRPVRLAVAALNRLYPVHLCTPAPDPSTREMARARGVGPGDRERLRAQVSAILERDPAAVAACQSALAEQRDRAAGSELFEKASELQETMRAIAWLTQPRAAARVEHLP